MKSIKLTVTRQETGAAFQVRWLGLHEKMSACMVDRPEGTRDYLFMLFHSEVRVKTREGESLWTSPGLIVWTPVDGHYYGNPNTAWNHSWFHCSGSDIAPILKSCGVPVRKRIAVTDPSFMEHYLLEVIAELSGWVRPDAKIIRNLFENFVRALARHASHKAERLAPARLLAVRSHVEQHFTEQISLGDLARRAGWSEPHLCAEFRRYFGIPVIQLVLQLRMNQAMYFLRDHNRRIGEIAIAVGYSDLFTFSKMFKRYLGISPKKFRESNSESMAPTVRRA
jgi:AraC family transcriptional regulator, arabinose operon regulatory protein